MIKDNDMLFDTTLKRFVLTEEYVYNNMGNIEAMLIDDTDTNPATILKRLLVEIRDMLYEYIEDNCVNKLSTQYYLATNAEANYALKKALRYQLETIIAKGDISLGVGNKVSQVISDRAIQALNANNVFFVIERQIPENVEEW